MSVKIIDGVPYIVLGLNEKTTKITEEIFNSVIKSADFDQLLEKIDIGHFVRSYHVTIMKPIDEKSEFWYTSINHFKLLLRWYVLVDRVVLDNSNDSLVERAMMHPDTKFLITCLQCIDYMTECRFEINFIDIPSMHAHNWLVKRCRVGTNRWRALLPNDLRLFDEYKALGVTKHAGVKRRTNESQ